MIPNNPSLPVFDIVSGIKFTERNWLSQIGPAMHKIESAMMRVPSYYGPLMAWLVIGEMAEDGAVVRRVFDRFKLHYCNGM